ncbi:ribosomal protein S6 kinase-related protein [Sphaeramia orbicularis]|uniref:ribosomal protein S6 kinase-related protein n=1 Tax=Sphaeramia orbicularis TaxID=375764 RepID=UPI00117C19DF|nr:ribosomal protein S6 kinase-related protein [Sphaeramia orbicularis]
MGSDISKSGKREGAAHHRRFSHGLLSVAHRLGQLGPSGVFSRTPHLDTSLSIPNMSMSPEDTAETSNTEKTPSDSTSLFLPEFPLRTFPGQGRFQILGFIAKGSFGPILKVKGISEEKTYAVKVLPKSEILKYGVLDQSKEEVIIQRQLKHPFIHNLQDCWQTQHHLFIMCDYCGVGDLYTCWLLKSQFREEEIRLFAAEMGSALGFLHDLGIMHRDVKMENILLSDQGHLRLSDFGLSRRLKRGGKAFTICGTIQYMAPEVLSGGPYNHAADWWSLGIMLFSLVTGKFPVPAESNHNTMFNKVRQFSYVPPQTCSTALTLLLTELLCKNPVNRLRNLECFKMQAFFRGTLFDPQILQKAPVQVILELRTHPDWPTKARRGLSVDQFDNFDCERILQPPTASSELSPSLANVDLSQAAEQTCEA